MRAIDSCIAIAARSKLVDNVYLYVLLEKAEHLFDMGEYSRCITYARIGARETLQLPDDKNQSALIYRIHFVNAEINSQLLLKNYDARPYCWLARSMNTNWLLKIHWHLYTIRWRKWKCIGGNYHQALNYFEKAIGADQAVGFKLGCMQNSQ